MLADLAFAARPPPVMTPDEGSGVLSEVRFALTLDASHCSPPSVRVRVCPTSPSATFASARLAQSAGVFDRAPRVRSCPTPDPTLPPSVQVPHALGSLSPSNFSPGTMIQQLISTPGAQAASRAQFDSAFPPVSPSSQSARRSTRSALKVESSTKTFHQEG